MISEENKKRKALLDMMKTFIFRKDLFSWTATGCLDSYWTDMFFGFGCFCGIIKLGTFRGQIAPFEEIITHLCTNKLLRLDKD